MPEVAPLKINLTELIIKPTMRVKGGRAHADS
jgi:hypothetical protein